MNKPIFAIILLLTVELFVAQLAQAQGTLYVSNLNQPSIGSGAVASDEWLAGVFGTGTNSGGYDMNSVQLLMNAASGSPDGFTVLLYNSNGVEPVSSLGSFSGSANPSAAGIFTYNASGFVLSPSTQYWIVLTATTPLANGSFNWSNANTAGFSSIDNWGLGGGFHSLNNGVSWNRDGRIFQFAINATAIPETSSFSIWLGSVLFVFTCRACKKSSPRI